jgi:succinate dehydrogenase flavin-adding protein (antitoxin of CptAB toxin-antitoxin module)
MRELDAVLQQFVDSSFADLDADDTARFEAILDLADPVLLAYLTGRSVPADPDIARLIDRIRAGHRPAT